MRWAIGLLFLCSCAKNTLPDYTRLESLRVLALRADKPEVVAGDSVTVTPVVSDVAGKGRALTYSAVGCVDPGVAFGASPSCASRPDRAVLASGAVPDLSGAHQTYTGAAPAVVFTVPAVILAGRSAADKFNGVAYLLNYTLTSADGESVVAFKRVFATTRPDRNVNPAVGSLLAGGAAVSAIPSTEADLSISPTGKESYSLLAGDGSEVTREELLTTTWFVSDGTLRFFRTLRDDTNHWTPPDPLPTGHGVVLVIVTRDGRGGEDFRQVEF